MTPEQIQQLACRFPDGYGMFRLKLPLHPTHKEVLNALFDKNNMPTKVSFRAGNGVGKTSIVAVCAIYYAIEVLGAKVVSTAAAYRQIKDQLMPNLRLYSHLFPQYRLLENKIMIGDDWAYTGFSTDEASTFQGFHELGFDNERKKPLLIIVDEAAGVKPVIFEQITRCSPDYLLVMGSPIGPEGIFYSVETDPNMSSLYKHFKMTQFDYLKENGYYLKRQEVEASIKEWGNDHPLIRSKVYAEFGSQIENGLISLNEVDRCYQYPPLFQDGKIHVALDFAAGGDENIIAMKRGNKVELIKCWRDTDTMSACQTFVEELEKLKNSYSITQNNVSGDIDGLGKGMIDRLKQLGWDICHFHGGGGKDDLTNDNYANKISECWMEGIKLMKSCAVIMPNDNEFKSQILSRKQTKNLTTGKLKLESKIDMKGRGIHSPDRADAIFMCMSNPNPGAVKYAHTNIRIPTQTYAGYW